MARSPADRGRARKTPGAGSLGRPFQAGLGSWVASPWLPPSWPAQRVMVLSWWLCSSGAQTFLSCNRGDVGVSGEGPMAWEGLG